MAKKLFGGKSNGRFSGNRVPSTHQPEPIPEDALPFLEDAAEEPVEEAAEDVVVASEADFEA